MYVVCMNACGFCALCVNVCACEYSEYSIFSLYFQYIFHVTKLKLYLTQKNRVIFYLFAFIN